MVGLFRSVEAFTLKQYVEFGVGNTWWVRTELEEADGTERELKGVRPFSRVDGLSLRLWIGRTVWIFSSNGGFQKTRKNLPAFKVLFGISGLPRH